MVVSSELLTYPPRSFQYSSFSGSGANLKLSAFRVCNDRFMTCFSTKSERETCRFFPLLISPGTAAGLVFRFPGCELKTVRFFQIGRRKSGDFSCYISSMGSARPLSCASPEAATGLAFPLLGCEPKTVRFSNRWK